MAATLGDLVNEVRSMLRSYTGRVERMAQLSFDLGGAATDTTFYAANSSVIGSGIIEIDDELMDVESTNGDNTVSVFGGFGRGFDGTAITTHAGGSAIVVDPMVPRKAIIDAIGHTARSIYPRVFAPKTKEFTFSGGQAAYDLDAGAERILSVSYQTVGPSGTWAPIRRYTLDQNADTTAFPSGKALVLGEAPMAGRTVRVVYAAPFSEMTASTDTLAAAGHSETQRDLLVYGALWRLVQSLEPSRLNLDAVENEERAKFSPVGAASQLTRQYLAIFERRLDEERQRLLQLYPVRPTFRS